MAKSNFVKVNAKIADAVVGGYQKIEGAVVGSYKKSKTALWTGI